MAGENTDYIFATTSSYKNFTVLATKNPLLQAILDKIESGDIDPRDVDWNTLLAAVNQPATVSSSPVSTSVTETEALSGFNLGLLIPLVIVTFFMMVLLLCTIRHSWNSRCKVVPKKKHSFSSLSRTQGESVRSSTRSRQLQQDDRSQDGLDHGQRSMLLPPVITKVGKLGSIRESPEDRYKNRKKKVQGEVDNNTPGSGKSITSAFSNVLTDFPYIVSNIGAYPVSVHSDCQQGCMTHSDPNLGNGAQYVSPYITWITPGMSQSDPMLSTNALTELESKLRKGLPCKLVQQMNPNTPADKNQMNKSPYHPNYNTPTNGSENDESIPSNAVINNSSSLMAPVNNATSIPVHVKPDILALKGMPNLPTLLLHRQSIPSGNTSTPGVCSGGKASSFDTTCISGQLSCPSSVGSWHYNDLYNQPGVPPMKNLLTQALLNSASRPLNGEILDPNHFLNDNNQMNITACQPSIVSMFPNVGSSNNSFQNNLQHNQSNENTSQSGEQVVLPPQSTNTSLCGHMDSCETSDNYSSMVTTGANSDQVSGYIAGPSHSTSIEKNSTLSNNFTNQSSVLTSAGSSTSNGSSSSSDQAISAIQNATVNSEASTGPQIFHQALSLDGTNASITLSFASTAKSAPAALHCHINPQNYLHMVPAAVCSSDTPQLPYMGRSTGLSSGLSNRFSSTGSGSTTPTVITQLQRPISNLSSNPSIMSKVSNTNPFVGPATAKTRGNGTATPAASSGTYEWDFYPFSGDDMAKSNGSTTPEVTHQSGVITQESMATNASTNPSVTSSQHRRRSNQPLLSEAQYWV